MSKNDNLTEKIEEWLNQLELGYTHENWNDVRCVMKEMSNYVK